MYGALVTHWKIPFPGREIKALEYGAEVNEYWGKLASEGKCTTPEMFVLADGTGMWLVKGDLAILEEFSREEASRRLLAKGALLLEGFGYQFAITGESGDEFMGQYAEIAAELGLT